MNIKEIEKFEKMKKSLEATQKLFEQHQGFIIKLSELYQSKLISDMLYAKTMISLQDISRAIQSSLLDKEQEYERAGGNFYDAEMKRNRGCILLETSS